MNNILERAAEHYLIENLGYDEGRFYYAYLTGREKQIEREYSYSKRYRILKNLFALGVIAKYKDQQRDNYTYKILPPYFETVLKNQIINFLSETYTKFHGNNKNFEKAQFIVCGDLPILTFFIKHKMKKEAVIIVDRKEIEKKLKENFGDTVEIRTNENQQRIIGMLDNVIFFEFVRISGSAREELIGYTTYEINEEIKRLFSTK